MDALEALMELPDPDLATGSTGRRADPAATYDTPHAAPIRDAARGS